MARMEYADYDEYWKAYLCAHSTRATRAFHYLGTVVGFGFGLAWLLTFEWYFLLASVVGGYAINVSSHWIFEKNQPLVNRPLWGIISDLRMCGLALGGRLTDARRR